MHSWLTHNIHQARRLDDAHVEALRQFADCIIGFLSYPVLPLIPNVLSISGMENRTVSNIRRVSRSRLTEQEGKLYTFNWEGKDLQICRIHNLHNFLFSTDIGNQERGLLRYKNGVV